MGDTAAVAGLLRDAVEGEGCVKQGMFWRCSGVDARCNKESASRRCIKQCSAGRARKNARASMWGRAARNHNPPDFVVGLCGLQAGSHFLSLLLHVVM
jgi:hypothetical protein